MILVGRVGGVVSRGGWSVGILPEKFGSFYLHFYCCRSLFLLFYVICAPVPTERTETLKTCLVKTKGISGISASHIAGCSLVLLIERT